MMIVLLAALVLTNVLLKQFLKVISIRLILIFVLTVVLVQMFVLLKQFIPNKNLLIQL